MGALVVLAAQAGSIEPGAEGESVVLVCNTGGHAGRFSVALEGPAAAWATVTPAVLTVGPGQEDAVWLRFRPPRSSATGPGAFPFTVTVREEAGGGIVAVESGSVEVGTFSAVTASLIAEPDVGARGVELAVEVANAGNRRVQVHLEAEAAGRGAAFDIEPAQVELGPGRSRVVVIRVRPRRRLLPGRADRRVTIAAVSDGGALATLRTEYPEDPSLADELFRSARVLVVVLAALTVAGISVLRATTDGDTIDVNRGTGTTLRLPSAAGPAPTGEAGETPDAGEEGAETPLAEGAAAQPAPPAPPAAATPGLPKLVFVRVYGPAARDLVVREAGARSSELRLRSDGSLETRPRLSPGGTHVAYIREQEASWKVCVIRAAGGEAVCLVDASAPSTVAWAPDGRSLYFTRGPDLYSVYYDVDTGVAGPERELGVSVPDGQFSLSPGGDRVVLVEQGRLAVKPLAGGKALEIEVPGTPEDPAWSPDGSRIVYTAGFQLFTAPVGSGPVRRLTADGTVNGEAIWCAEGDWVVFRSNRSGAGDLYALKGSSAEGTEAGLAQVTSTPEREITPSF